MVTKRSVEDAARLLDELNARYSRAQEGGADAIQLARLRYEAGQALARLNSLADGRLNDPRRDTIQTAFRALAASEDHIMRANDAGDQTPDMAANHLALHQRYMELKREFDEN